MNGLELNKINQYIIEILEKNFKSNLFAVISTGSIACGYYKENWSDVDIMIVVEKLDLRTKNKMTIITNVLEKKFKKHFGVNIINKQELLNPILPTISMEGKTLQSLLELKNDQKRLIYCKSKLLNNFYFPDKNDIKKYSLSNISMFLLRNRKTLCRQNSNANNFKNIVAKEMRASFIMTKLAIQYFNLYTCFNNEETIRVANKLFSDFDFKALKINLQSIKNWNKINKQQLDKLLLLNDSFIEHFCQYVFKKTQK